jgi:putative ABC transport system permease protein
MDWARLVRTSFRPAGHDPDPDIVEELAQHAAAVYARARADGAAEDEALREVSMLVQAWTCDARAFTQRSRRAPAVEPVVEDGAGWWTGGLHDLRYATRMLARQPGSALLAALTIAIGVSATTVLFSVVYGVLARPLPWPDAHRLMQVVEMREGSPSRFGPVVTNAAYLAWAEEAQTIEGLAAVRSGSVTMTGAGSAERLRVAAVTASLLHLLQTGPFLGRAFEPADEREGAGKVVLLSHGLWNERFGAAEDVVGRLLELDRTPYTIVGVMPAGFSYPDREVRAWTPFRVPPATSESGVSMFSGIAKLRTGITPAQAASEATARAAQANADTGLLDVAVFGRTGAREVAVVPLVEQLTREVRPALLVLLAAVGLLLVAATGNVAAVLLARAAGRRRELAVRAAIGAGTARLVRQVVAECLVIGTAGAAVGLAVAGLLHRGLPAVLPADFPRIDAVAFDWRVAGFAVAAALASALLAGVLPALQARRVDVTAALAEDGLAPVGWSLRTRTSRVRAGLVVLQIAAAATLLVGAALLGRSFLALANADRGYDPAGVLTASLPMPAPAYDPARRTAILEGVLERVRAAPAVTAAAMTNIVPLGGSEAVRAFTVPARNPADPPVTLHAAFRAVSPGYFSAMSMRVLEGRPLDDGDTATSRRVVVVNRSFARQVFEGHAVGREIPIGGDDQGWEVVGVVEDIWRGATSAEVQSETFVSYRQWTNGISSIAPVLVLRTSGSAAALAPLLRTAVREQDEHLALEGLASMEERVRHGLAQPRLYAVVLAAFALAAVAVAGIGMFGALACSVAQRRRELGLRGALGARPIDIVRLVVAQGLAMMSIGLALGWVLALSAAGFLSSLLFGVEARDPLTFVLGSAALVLAAGVACAVPAWRAARLDPLTALRG